MDKVDAYTNGLNDGIEAINGILPFRVYRDYEMKLGGTDMYELKCAFASQELAEDFIAHQKNVNKKIKYIIEKAEPQSKKKKQELKLEDKKIDMDNKKSRNCHYILSEIYGFPDKEIRSGDNGSWDIEQYMDDEMVYQARILPDQDTYISVFTRDRFPKTIAEYKFEPEDAIKTEQKQEEHRETVKKKKRHSIR